MKGMTKVALVVVACGAVGAGTAVAGPRTVPSEGPSVSIAKPSNDAVKKPSKPAPKFPPPRVAAPLSNDQIAKVKAQINQQLGGGATKPMDGPHSASVTISVAQPVAPDGSYIFFYHPWEVVTGGVPTPYASFDTNNDFSLVWLEFEKLRAGGTYLLDCLVDTSKTPTQSIEYYSFGTTANGTAKTWSGHLLLGFKADADQVSIRLTSGGGPGGWALMSCTLSPAG